MARYEDGRGLLLSVDPWHCYKTLLYLIDEIWKKMVLTDSIHHAFYVVDHHCNNMLWTNYEAECNSCGRATEFSQDRYNVSLTSLNPSPPGVSVNILSSKHVWRADGMQALTSAQLHCDSLIGCQIFFLGLSNLGNWHRWKNFRRTYIMFQIFSTIDWKVCCQSLTLASIFGYLRSRHSWRSIVTCANSHKAHFQNSWRFESQQLVVASLFWQPPSMTKLDP